MSKSILVLDENSVVHGLVASALDIEGVNLHHEFNPGRYAERAHSLMPDLILVGNSAQDPNFDVCRSLKSGGQLQQVPVVLLAGSRDAITPERMGELQLAGVVRKPFEASDLQQQVSKHLDMADLVGSAYEFRQTQSAREEGANPLANLDVVDDELRDLIQDQSQAAPGPRSGPVPGAEVVDEEVLAAALEPERAFEPVEGDVPLPAGEVLGLPGDDSLQEDGLEELGAADLLEEEGEDEAVLEPQGFDQSLEQDAPPPSGPSRPAGPTRELDDIEVELSDDALDFGALDDELGEGEVELFESELGEQNGGPSDSVPLSVRRMMDLKPVFTVSQEQAAAGYEDMGEEDVEEQPLEYMDEDEARSYVEAESATAGLGAERVPAPEPVEEAFSEDVRVEDELEAEGIADDVFTGTFDVDPEEPLTEEELYAAAAPGLDGSDDGDLEPLEEEDIVSGGFYGAETHAEPLVDEESTFVAEPIEELEDDDDYLLDEYLGDDEIDEEQIMQAMSVDAADEDLAENEELDALMAEDSELTALDAVEDLDELSGTFGDDSKLDSEIDLEPEEEDLIFAGYDSDDAPPLFERNLGALDEEGSTEPPAEMLAETPGLSLEGGRGETLTLGMPLGEEPLNVPEPEDLEAVQAESEAPAMGDLDEPMEDFSLDEPTDFSLDEPTEEVSLDEPQEDVSLDEPMEDYSLDESADFSLDEPTDFSLDEPQEDVSWDDEEAPAEVYLDEAPSEDLGLDSGARDREQDAALEVLSDEDLEEAPGLEATGALDEAEPLELSAEDLEDEAPAAGLDEEPFAPQTAAEEFSIEFGAGEGVFDSDDDGSREGEWQPTAPAAFVAAPGEEFPREAISDKAVGPHLDTVGGSSSLPARFASESLEVPDPSTGEVYSASGAAADMADTTEPGGEALEHLLGGETLGDAGPANWDGATVDDLIENPEIEDVQPDWPTRVDDGVDLEAPDAGDDGEDYGLGSDSSDAGAGGDSDGGFDDMFASLRADIAANPEGEHLDDVLRTEAIRDGAARLPFSVPSSDHPFARALGIYALPNQDEDSSFLAAVRGNGAAAVAAAASPSAASPSAAAASVLLGDSAELSLLDPDIRNKLGAVLDEIISVTVRKAVHEEMPRLLERMSKENR